MKSATYPGRNTASQLALAIHLGLFALAGQVHAAEPPASASQPATQIFDIPAQPLGLAVLAFADQAGLQVLFDSARLKGLSSSALKGRFSAQEGLGRLLGSAPVEYRFTGERQVTLARTNADNDSAMTVGTTTITGQHKHDWVYSSPQSVSVIGREQLDRNPPRHAAEVLEEAPGVYSAVSQQDPGLSVNIRGIQDYGRVNMSVDGMRQNYQQSGHQQRNGTLYVDPELLSDVVVEKGATSTMGGAGVIGGIANFRTVEAADLLKDGKEIGGRIRLTTGLGGRSNGTHFIGSSAFAVGTNAWDMLLAASERHLGDYDPGTKGSIGDLRTGTAFMPASQDRIKNSPVGYSGSVMRSRLLKLGLNLPADQRLQLSYLLTEVDYDDVSMMTVEKPHLWEKLGSSNVKAQNFALDYSYTPDDPLIDFKAKLYHVDTRNDQTTLTRGRNAGYDVTYQTNTYGAQAQNLSTFALSELSVLKASYGVEFFYDKVRPDSNQPVEEGSAVTASASESITPKGDRSLGSLFGRLEYDYDGWLNLNAGLRYDRYRLRGETGLNTRTFIIGTTRQIGVPVTYDIDREEGHFSPTFGLSIKPGVDWLQLFATYGKGWRPPAVTEALVSGRPHGGGSESIFPNPYLKPEQSTAWEVGFNVLKEDLLFAGDRVGMKVSYFNTRVDDFSFMTLGVQRPGFGGVSIGNAAYVNNLETTRFRGLEYQLDYDAGFAYGQVNYTRMLGSNRFCSKTAWLGGVTKIQKRPGNRMPVDAMVPDDAANAAVGCSAILGSSEHMPMDRGTATLGARFFERKLDMGVRARYSAGYYVKGGIGVTTSQTGVYPADWKPYTVYDLYSSYRATDQLTLRLAMENVTDRAYLVPLGDVLAFTLGRGRTLQGTVEYEF